MKELYEKYLKIMTSIREFFNGIGVVEFIPSCSAPRLITDLKDQITVEKCKLILPYSQTFAKPIASLFLGKSVWMAAPCYRDDEGDNHLKWYYQITAEFLNKRMDEVIPIACDLIKHVGHNFGKGELRFDEIDLSEYPDIKTNEDFSAWCKKKICEMTRPLVVLNKPHVIPPYAHRSYEENPNMEVGFDILLPEIGEVMSGGERNMNLIRESYRFSNVDIPDGYSTSIGMGLERFVKYLLDLKNIQDAVLLHNKIAEAPWSDIISQNMYYERIPKCKNFK